MRLKNSIRNAIFAAVFQIVSLVLSFANRIIITRLLGVEYLGINSVFTNLVYLFSVAECGINFAIIYAMYSAMAKADDKKLIALIQLFKKIYFIIGTIILALGLCLLPFLNFIIGDNNISHVMLIYSLFLVNSVIPYYFASRKSVVSVAQKEYMLTIATNVAKIVQLGVQAVLLLVLKDYIVYVSAMVFMTLVANVATVFISNKVYPQQRCKQKYYLEKEEKRLLFANVRALVIANISGIIFNGTDSIVISHWMGLKAVGIYSNYFMVYTSLFSVLSMGINAITASVGNLGALSSSEEIYEKYKRVFYINFFVIALFTSEMLISFQDVMSIAYGSDLLLTLPEMLFVVLNFLLVSLRLPTLVFRNAIGIFKQDRYKGIFEVVINLTLSIVLVHYIGILGVLLGTFVSTILVSIWIEPYMLFKHGFKMKTREYVKFILPYMIFIVVICGLCFGSNYLPLEASIAKIAIEWVSLGIIVTVTYLLIFHKKPESDILKKMLSTFRHKKAE